MAVLDECHRSGMDFYCARLFSSSLSVSRLSHLGSNLANIQSHNIAVQTLPVDENTIWIRLASGREGDGWG